MPGGAAPKPTGNITTPTGTRGAQKPAVSAGLNTLCKFRADRVSARNFLYPREVPVTGRS